MKNKPVLVIMAAGMGSRYGGLKQIDPVDTHGNLIIDFSIYDAIEAGFETIIFIIKRSMEMDFKSMIGNRISKLVTVEYVYQELGSLPEGYKIPEGREKPWGTGHAVFSCKSVLNSSFAVINADDYYGKSAFKTIYRELLDMQDQEKYHYTMVGYQLYNTLTEYGHVARGVCTLDENHKLTAIKERTRIEKHGNIAEYIENNGNNWMALPENTIVSMNMWGFTKSILVELEERFAKFLDEEIPKNPLKCEYFLPFAVGELLKEEKAEVKVLDSSDGWYGVTYREDKEIVVQAVQNMKHKGLYPENLWGNTHE